MVWLLKNAEIKKRGKTCSSGLCAPLGKTRWRQTLKVECLPRYLLGGVLSPCFVGAVALVRSCFNWLVYLCSFFVQRDRQLCNIARFQAGLTSWTESGHILPCHRGLEFWRHERVFQNCKGQPNARANARARSPEIRLREWIFVRMDRNATLSCKEVGNFLAVSCRSLKRGDRCYQPTWNTEFFIHIHNICVTPASGALKKFVGIFVGIEKF